MRRMMLGKIEANARHQQCLGGIMLGYASKSDLAQTPAATWLNLKTCLEISNHSIAGCLNCCTCPIVSCPAKQ